MVMVRNFCLLVFAAVFAVTPLHAAPHLSLDLDNGRVLSREQAFDAWHPASLTKLMTAWVVFRAIENGEISGDSPVRVSANARKAPPSKMGYGTGTVMTVDNALKLLIVKSANDIAVAIAESLSGSVPRFADRMNREAKALGMTGSTFRNPHGLHDPRQVTTARDMGLLVRAIHTRMPQYASLFSTPSVLAPQRTKKGKTIQRVYYSYNLLLERYRGGDGFKTGFVCASGYNFIGAASRGGRRIAAIVLGRDSQTSRAVDAARLITQGFEQPLDAGTPIDELKPSAEMSGTPRNMRPVMCSEAARAARYEPGAGQAVIDSPWLQARSEAGKPLKVTLGGTNGPVPGRDTIALGRVPLPNFRPGVSALRRSIATGVEVEAIDRRNSTLPTFRPST